MTATTGVEESVLELRDGRFAIRVRQAGDGDPVVFLHGERGWSWDPLLDVLAAEHRVIAPEHPGAGASTGLEHVEDLWDLVLYHDELFDALGHERVSLVGHSFGAMVAAEIAATRPERVDRLVLVAPIGLWRDEHPVADLSGVPASALPGLLLADPTGPLAEQLRPPGYGDPEAMFRAAMTTASILQFTWPLPDKGLRKRLHRVRAATLIVWGAEDRFTDPAYGEDFAAAIAGARLELVPGAGHLPHLERPDATTPLVTSFLAG